MKPFTLCFFLLTLFGAHTAFSQAVVDRGNPKTHAELLKLVREIRTAEIKGQKDVLQKRTAEDFLLCGPSGELIKREAYLATPARAFSEYSFNVDDAWLLDRGDTAVLVYLLEINLKLDTKQTKTRQRVTDVFNKTASGWELVSSQRTNTAEAKPTPAAKGSFKMN